MAILKCKMCGGDLLIQPGKTFGTCEYCGCTMTLPKIDDEQRAAAFNRGNHFRRIGEFDKALAVYEHIIQEAPADAEAHWCCALCRFGIEYVEDPATYEYLPTCHRASFDSFLEDVDYLAALDNSEGITRRQYQKDAAKIEEVRRGILTTSQSEEPFDIFICYKETDENGQRTKDSLMAQEIYYQLTDQGRRVFFARITLEDKVGSQYEPYIFAALNSAKVMICVGTKPEHFNAVWVKNEWSRFLALMKRDRSKLLLPCYRDMDPYDLPEQLAVLQSYDMAKIGFIQDLTRGISKVLTADAPAKPTQPAPVEVKPAAVNTEPILKRAFMFLEDGDWQQADDYCEKVLDQDPENAQAYLGKLMAELKVRRRSELKDCAEPFDDNNYYQKAIRFGNAVLVKELRGYVGYINDRNENTRLTGIYDNAKNAMNAANTEDAFKAAADMFAEIPGFKDADTLAEQCLEKAEKCKQERIAKEEADRIAKEKAAKNRKKAFAIGMPIVCVCIVFVIVLKTVIIPKVRYNIAVKKYGKEWVEIVTASVVGDVIKFGAYEQDNNSSNGKETIEWVVIDKKDMSVMLLSKYALDCQQYNTSYTNITWEECSLRTWLNDTFLNSAFSSDEQLMIATTNVYPDENPNYSTNPGNATTDKVFLLSIAESEKYFTANESRKCVATDYVKAQGANIYYTTASGEATCWCWLRSPGYNQHNAAGVYVGGSVDYYGQHVHNNTCAVRPAIWISLE